MTRKIKKIQLLLVEDVRNLGLKAYWVIEDSTKIAKKNYSEIELHSNTGAERKRKYRAKDPFASYESLELILKQLTIKNPDALSQYDQRP